MVCFWVEGNLVVVISRATRCGAAATCSARPRGSFRLRDESTKPPWVGAFADRVVVPGCRDRRLVAPVGVRKSVARSVGRPAVMEDDMLLPAEGAAPAPSEGDRPPRGGDRPPFRARRRRRAGAAAGGRSAADGLGPR